MNEIYRQIVEGLRARTIRTNFQSDDQLVISRQHGPVLPFGGNSFWISNEQGVWHLCTWSPNCYRVPLEADMIGLCEEFVDFGSGAQGKVPVHIVKRFGLIKLSDEEAAEMFGW